MRILSIESSSRCATVAIADCPHPVSEDSKQILSDLLDGPQNNQELLCTIAHKGSDTIPTTGPAGASAGLAPIIKRVLADAQTDLSTIDLICVGIGPGSFTGLRVGIVTAKTLAYAVSCDVVGVHAADAFAVEAAQHIENSLFPCELSIGLDIGRGEVLAYRYQLSGDDFHGDQQGAVLQPADWISGLSSNDWVSGSAVKYIDQEKMSSFNVVDAMVPSAMSIASVGLWQFLRSGPSNLWKLEPVYSRPSAAEERLKS